MKTIAIQTADVTLSSPELLELAGASLTEEGLPGVPQALALLAQEAGLATTEQGQIILIEAIALIVDACARSDISDACNALAGCPADLAAQAHALFLTAFFPEGSVDIAELDDAAMLCVTLLAATAGERADALALLHDAIVQRSNADFIDAANALKGHIGAAAEGRFKPKLIIWDLDDTLWRGTLAEGDAVAPFENRVEFVRAFNRHGLVSAICSKNDPEIARRALEGFGLWDEFVFPRIAFVPKGAAVKQIIEDMQLRPANVLFVDDNPHNLQEVAAAVPGVHVMDATSTDCDLLLAQILEDHRGVTKSRVDEYRILEARVEARAQSTMSNEAFLLESGIHAAAVLWMDNLDFVERIEELINRSNQLNYTESRVVPGSLAHKIMDVANFDARSVFLWDKYGDYGLVGFAMVDKQANQLAHFVFSCRAMHMGVEDFLLSKMRERYGDLDLSLVRKSLIVQSRHAITEAFFHDPEIRQRILTRQAQRSRSHIGIRFMCDCQSGGLVHYSRFRDEAEFDNHPRVFSLPTMFTGEYRDQHFPPCLVYTPSIDYREWRWGEVTPVLDEATYAEAAERFCRFIVEKDRRMLVLLPPTNAAEHKYAPIVPASQSFEREKGLIFNAQWKLLAERFSHHIQCVDLSDVVTDDDMADVGHYLPHCLQTMSGLIDDWYAPHSAQA